MTVDSNSAKGADPSPPASEDTPLLPASPTTQVSEYEESLVFSLIFVLPSAILFVISFIACVIPSTWSAYSFITKYWHYPGSLPLTCWLLLYPIVWSIPPTINVLAWHGIFRNPLTLPEAQPKIPSTRVGRQLLAWSIPRALLYLNIVFLVSIALTILFTSELRRFDWLAALAAIWGAFVLTWVSSQINFYARRRVKRLMEISEMSDGEDENEEEQEADGDMQAEAAGSTAQKRSRANSTASSGKSEALSAASQPAPKPKMIARIPSNHSRLLPARFPLYRLTTESTLYLVSFIATLLLLNIILRARESILYPPPGERFTTKDGTVLHVECQGSTSFGEKNVTVPTILFEPGASVLASHHVAFLTELEQAGQIGRYCWYDRAGYGWSSSGVLPATAETEADQAYEVIVQKMNEESLIIVGHSFGGMIARLFAAKYPQHVVGLVLLDASHEDELYWTEVHGKPSSSLAWAIRKWQWSCMLYDFVWLILEPIGVDRWIPIWSIGDEGWKSYGEKTRSGLLNGRALQASIRSFSIKILNFRCALLAISSEVRNLVTLSAEQVRSTRPAPFIDTNSASMPSGTPIFPPDLPVSVVTSGELGCQHKECQDDEEDSKKAWTELQRDLAYNLSLVHDWTIAPSSTHILWRDEAGASAVKEAVVKMFRSKFGHTPASHSMLSHINRISRASYRTSAVARAAGAVHGRTPLTVTKHPKFQRDARFQALNDTHLKYFQTVLEDNAIKYDKDSESEELAAYNTDWFNLYRGSSSLVLFPKETGQVSSILKYCNDNHLAVVPQGGNTGVSGGATPVFDEVIINMSRMNRIRNIDTVSGIAVADAGVILESLDNAVSKHGYMVPLDLGAKGSCHIGGNVSTNAGGLRYLRYGSLHGSVLGLEVVLPDGTILENLSTLRKDNTGYDLKQLFIGAEGTLGIVTGVSILTPQRAKSTNIALIGLNSFEDIQKAFIQAKIDLSDILSAFEFWDKDCIEVVSEKMMPGVQFPIASEKPYEFYALLETQGSRREHDEAKLENYLTKLLEDNIAQDGVVSQDIKQTKQLWAWREMIPEGITKYGPAITYDVSMDIPLLYKLVRDARAHFFEKNMLGTEKDYVKLIGFGHVGDGNLHIMAATNRNDYKLQKELDEYVYSWASKNRGSISAEHGIGISKIQYLNYSKKQPMIDLMQRMKKQIDPNGIMNPYKIFG